MQHYPQLEAVFEKISHLNHLLAIAGWDEAVMMPKGGGDARAKALATLQGQLHELLVDPKNGELLSAAKQENLDDWQQANLHWMEKEYRSATCLPTDLVKCIKRCRLHCEQAWRSMRGDNNWQDFKPLLEENLKLTKESALIRADVFNMDPYDVLIDEFSPGLNQQIIDPIFQRLKNTLPDLINKITDKQSHEKTLHSNGQFGAAQQKQLGLTLMKSLGFNFDHGRLDVSHHPFCGGVPQDVRITTRYNDHEFVSAAMAVCHETGHARYEQGLPDKWIDQPVGRALGMSVHESQSLLVEMQACRSQAFMQHLAPLVQQQFGDDPAYTADNLFRLYTRVKPSYIRVDADEVTYPLHVILRYELEQQLMRNDISIADLPDAWDSAMQCYLGLSTKDEYRNGVMQDVHWPSGVFGYFPAYTLGSIIAAQLFVSAKKANADLMDDISRGDFSTLFAWLGKHVHSRASSVSVEQLLIDATGETLNADHFLNHFNERYLS